MLKPYVEQILTQAIIPILMLSEKDLVMFETEPIEYIGRMADFATVEEPKNQV